MSRATTTYLVLPPAETKLGGAEKRLIGLWSHVVRQGRADMRLVINDTLLALLREAEEFADIDRFADKVVAVSADRLLRVRFASVLARLRAREPRAVFHLAMIGPGLALPVPGKRTLYTLAAAHLSNFSFRGRLDVYRACLRSRRVDALDAGVADALARRLPVRRSKITVTPGSFVDLERYTAAPAREKKNRFVFLGTFIPNKQVYRLLEKLPAIHDALTAKGHRDLEYVFLGRDSAGLPSATEIIARLQERIPVRAFYATSPAEVLRESKVFFSLQRLENYPSKALLEGMACGCLPIVTDVGKSRQVASEDFAWFVPGPFEAKDIAGAATEILALSPEAFDERVALSRDFLRRRFSIDTMTDYYLDLYDAIATEAR